MNAGAPAPAAFPVELLIWIGVGIALIVALGVIVVVARGRILRDPPPDSGGGLMLSDLRAMRNDGRMTEDEYQAARSVLLGAAARSIGATPARERTRPGEPPERVAGDGDTAGDGR